MIRLSRAEIRFSCFIGGLYLVTLAVVAMGLRPYAPLGHSTVTALRTVRSTQALNGPVADPLSGRPVRLVIPGSSIDLPLQEGFFNSLTDTWTLSGYYGQYAMNSAPANNVSGQTFVYGHNNDFVLGALRHQTPSYGSLAFVYTSNNHIFVYRFISVTSLSPTDTSILTYNGPPMLLIQTCTGSLNEWRTEYSFSFYKVLQ